MVAYKLIIDEGSGVLVAGIASWKWMNIMCAIITLVIFAPLVIFVRPFCNSLYRSQLVLHSFPTLLLMPSG